MIKGINESKILTKCRYGFDGRKRFPIQKWNSGKCHCEYKNQCMKNCLIKDYAWIASTCACECDKDCEIGEYLEHCESIEKFCR